MAEEEEKWTWATISGILLSDFGDTEYPCRQLIDRLGGVSSDAMLYLVEKPAIQGEDSSKVENDPLYAELIAGWQ
jgi:hypothetical protein